MTKSYLTIKAFFALFLFLCFYISMCGRADKDIITDHNDSITCDEKGITVYVEDCWYGKVHYIAFSKSHDAGIGKGFCIVNYTADSTLEAMNRKYDVTNSWDTDTIIKMDDSTYHIKQPVKKHKSKKKIISASLLNDTLEFTEYDKGWAPSHAVHIAVDTTIYHKIN